MAFFHMCLGSKASACFAVGLEKLLYIFAIPNANIQMLGQVRKRGTLLQDFEQFMRKVYSFCKEILRSATT
jgi:hypothetical protein